METVQGQSLPADYLVIHTLLLLLFTFASAASGADRDDVSPKPAATLPERASIMRWHTNGRKPTVNVYSAQDSRRPLIGVHVYFDPAIKDLLPHLTDVFDFITHDDHSP